MFHPKLGRINELDIERTFEAFARLDIDNDGKLNSRDIIATQLLKKKKKLIKKQELKIEKRRLRKLERAKLKTTL